MRAMDKPEEAQEGLRAIAFVGSEWLKIVMKIYCAPIIVAEHLLTGEHCLAELIDEALTLETR